MAVCDYCNQEMMLGVGCTQDSYVINGVRLHRLHVDPEWCNQQGQCGDCGAPAESLHHPGCDVERCPACGCQAIGCDCPDGEDDRGGVDELDDARALALRLKSILRQFPTTLESLDADLAWENLPDWFTGDDQGVKLWRRPDE